MDIRTPALFVGKAVRLLRGLACKNSNSTFSTLHRPLYPKHVLPATSKQAATSVRRYSDGASTVPPLCAQMKQRGLVQLAGEDASVFLQGLITNDIRCLDQCCATLYAMMLNVQGRVLYDMIVYNLGHSSISHEQSYILECDSEVTEELVSLMKKYKIRKKVDITNLSSDYSLWALMPAEEGSSIQQCDLVPSHPEQLTICASDPRLKSFGCRMILPVETDAFKMFHGGCNPVPLEEYHRRRYKLGIGEGILDLPPGNCFPLESNAVFLNGVSFNKGCYIGQELTARTHHTGVIRKRLMPIVLASEVMHPVPGDTIENFANKNCGKFRNSEGVYGLALLRVAEALGKSPLTIKHNGEAVGEASTQVPPWWPKDYTTDEIPGYKVAT